MTHPEIRVDAQHGAAITSIRALGREWLVQGPGAPDPTATYTASPPRGWDEMLPSIEACDSPLGRVPDHGDAWREPWRDAGSNALGFTSRFGYSVERTLHVRDGGFDLEYRLIGTGPLTPVLWAAHPLFSAELGTQLSIPGYHGPMWQKFPEIGRLNWSDVPKCASELQPGTSAKFILPIDQTVGVVTLTHADGSGLRMSWNSDTVPYLGIYLENCQYSMEPAIAIEPMLGWFDSLERALGTGRIPWVSQEDALTWNIHVDFFKDEAEQGPRR